MNGHLIDIKTVTVIIAVIVAAFLFSAFYLCVYLPFRDDREYVKMEMQRATSEKEYLYWKRELKYLYLQMIPFVRKFFR